jgi:hypothetical protein
MLILSSHLRLGLPADFPTKSLYYSHSYLQLLNSFHSTYELPRLESLAILVWNFLIFEKIRESIMSRHLATVTANCSCFFIYHGIIPTEKHLFRLQNRGEDYVSNLTVHVFQMSATTGRNNFCTAISL